MGARLSKQLLHRRDDEGVEIGAEGSGAAAVAAAGAAADDAVDVVVVVVAVAVVMAVRVVALPSSGRRFSLKRQDAQLVHCHGSISERPDTRSASRGAESKRTLHAPEKNTSSSTWSVVGRSERRIRQ